MACSGASLPSAASSSPSGRSAVLALPPLLVIEGVLHMLIAGAYVPALYFSISTTSRLPTPLPCARGRHLYQSKGYSGFSCSFHGGDIGAGIFAALGIGGLWQWEPKANRGYQKVRKLKEKPAEMLEF